ncbi:MAG TPA: HEAT repeat domain-containing protein [Usitatibacter sp.]|nr:HEAT repeat domain-containing protein [Usitatibacter sp.]
MAPRVQAWSEAMRAAMENPGAARLPHISALELPAFASLWNQFRQSAKGVAADNLATLLREQGIDDRLLALLGRRRLRPRLIAITALGHLREARAWGRLEAIAHGRSRVTSFAAARALLRIEPRKALQVLGPSILEREDWPLTRLGTILDELGPTVVTPALVTLLVSRPRRRLERAVKLARFGQRQRIGTIVRGWLSAGDDPDVIKAALDYVEEASELPWVHGAARHPEWPVRMAAAQALARVGSRSEVAMLLELLRDPVWWVRYHAAQGLTSLNGLDEDELHALREGTRDAFAVDMLAQALAQRRRR